MASTFTSTFDKPITYPVRAYRGAVYDMIFDAEDRVVTFVEMNQRSREITQLVVDLLNAAHATPADAGVEA